MVTKITTEIIINKVIVTSIYLVMTVEEDTRIIRNMIVMNVTIKSITRITEDETIMDITIAIIIVTGKTIRRMVVARNQDR